MARSIIRANLGLTEPKESNRPEISFAAKDIDVVEWEGDILAVGVTEKDMEKDENSKFKNSILQKLDLQLGGLLSEASSEKADLSLVLRLPASLLGSRRVGLFGLAAAAPLPSVAYCSLGEAVAAVAKSSQTTSVAITLASAEEIPAELKPNIASAKAIGVTLGAFEDNRFGSESKKLTLRSVDIIGFGSGPEIDDKLRYAEYVSSGIILGKELVNAPANVLTPGALAEEASKISSEYRSNNIGCGAVQRIENGCILRCYCSICQSSIFHPSSLQHTSTTESRTKLDLVGKGLTFDRRSSITRCSKSSRSNKDWWSGACENMISGSGMRPGNIVTASNGKTIEVNNNDAEGRLTLAEAFVFACNQGVEKMVDLATLTGDCITALGPSVAGVFTPSDEMAKEVLGAAALSGEKPMEESYWDVMKSEVADMRNLGVSEGGAITAALFLNQFFFLFFPYTFIFSCHRKLDQVG